MIHKSLLAVVCSTALLAACGGFSGGPSVTSEVPASASASIAGFIDYLKELVVTPAETLEPVDVSSVTPPRDDTSSPVPID